MEKIFHSVTREYDAIDLINYYSLSYCLLTVNPRGMASLILGYTAYLMKPISILRPTSQSLLSPAICRLFLPYHLCILVIRCILPAIQRVGFSLLTETVLYLVCALLVP